MMRNFVMISLIAILGALLVTVGCGPTEQEPAAPAEEVAAPTGAGVTQAARDQIEPGMTYEQVVEVVGVDGELVPVEVYQWEDGAKVFFRDGVCVEAVGTTGMLDKTYEEVVQELGAEGEKLYMTRYTWTAPEGAGTITVDFEQGTVTAVSSSMLPVAEEAAPEAAPEAAEKAPSETE